jgi:hypothetical protein
MGDDPHTVGEFNSSVGGMVPRMRLMARNHG